MSAATEKEVIITRGQLILVSADGNLLSRSQDEVLVHRLKTEAAEDDVIWQVTLRLTEEPKRTSAEESRRPSRTSTTGFLAADVAIRAEDADGRPVRVDAGGCVEVRWTYPARVLCGASYWDEGVNEYLGGYDRDYGSDSEAYRGNEERAVYHVARAEDCTFRPDVAPSSAAPSAASSAPSLITPKISNFYSCVVVNVTMNQYRTKSPPTDVTAPGNGTLMKALLDSERLADVTFVVSGVEIRAHTQVLGALSAVFLGMFDLDKDKADPADRHRVSVDDVNPAVFKEMLRCVYMDCEPQSPHGDEDFITELLLLAKKYQLAGLEAHCLRRLLHTLSVDNVCGRLETVGVVCPAFLEKIVSSFVKDNLQEILLSSAWSALQDRHAALAANVMFKAITSSAPRP